MSFERYETLSGRPQAAEDLRRFVIFQHAPADVLKGALLRMVQRDVGAGEQWNLAEPRLMLIWSGYVRQVRISPSGQHFTLRSAGPGASIGVAAVFAGGAYEHYSFVADHAGLVLQWNLDDVLQLASAPECAGPMFHEIGREAVILAERLFEHATWDTLSRLKAEILRLCDRGGVRRTGEVFLHLCPTHEVLASRIGSTREVVTRHIKTLRLQGLLGGTRKQIIVLDRERLEALTPPRNAQSP